MTNKTKTTRKAKKIGIITYNCIGNGSYDNGWMNKNGNKYMLIQNGHKSKWAAYGGSDDRRESIRAGTIESLLEENIGTLKRLDHVYLYVGSNGGEVSIKMTKEIPSEKLTYVMCHCNSELKHELINRYGHINSEIMDCSCGGHYALGRILEKR